MTDIRGFAHELTRLGASQVFGIPGEGPSLELIDELERGGVRFHSVSHEAAAALMAGGFGRAAGIPGMCLSIKGPGFSNMLAGVTSNWLDRNPSLSLSESYGPGSSADRMHKRLPHAAMAKPVVKAYANNPHQDLLPQLWNLCLSEEPGPVHVDISSRMTGTTFEGGPVEQDLEPLPQRLAAMMKAARKPVLIVGSLATRRAWRESLAFLTIPVFTTVAGKGACDETGPWSGGVFTNAGGPYAPETSVLQEADLVVGLGLRTTEILDVRPLHAPLLLLDELSHRAKGLAPAMEATVKEDGFREAIDLLKGKQWGDQEVRAAKTKLEDRLATDQWMPAGAFRVAQHTLPASTVYVLDTGSFCTIGEHVLLAERPGRIMGSACGRSMGVAIPFGIGAAFGLKGTSTVIVIGDGGVRMYPEAITTAVRENMPVLVMLMNDGSYASIRHVAESRQLTTNPLHLDSSRWRPVFRSLGCASERVVSLASLEQALKSWRQFPEPLFLELKFNPTRYLHMTEGIR